MINLCLIKNNQNIQMNWNCKQTWRRASKNTLWCLIGCSIGDFGISFTFQNIEHSWTVSAVMALAIVKWAYYKYYT